MLAGTAGSSGEEAVAWGGLLRRRVGATGGGIGDGGREAVAPIRIESGEGRGDRAGGEWGRWALGFGRGGGLAGGGWAGLVGPVASWAEAQ